MDLVSKTRFNKAPTISKRRTRFDLSHSILTTFNTGDFVPVLCEPVYPGETHSLRTSSLTRLETSLHQTMDNAYIEFAYFFVPSRLVWANFDKFLGANDDPWTQSNEYHIPQIILQYYDGTNGRQDAQLGTGSLLHHLMLPAGSYGYQSGNVDVPFSVDALPLRSVFKVWSDWYRDENYDSIIYSSTGDNDIYLNATFLLNGSYFSPRNSNLKVNRFKDVFSTALPAPQRGQEVTFGFNSPAPIIAGDTMTDLGGLMKFMSREGTEGNYTNTYAGSLKFSYDSSTPAGGKAQLDTQSSTIGDGHVVTHTNLVADLSSASAITINQLRLAIAAQAIAERDARGGTRLKEKIYATWGVDCPDARLDRSEFLGGKRFPINMMEVLQTSETGTTVLGSDAGHSKTTDSSDSFIKSFTEYGWLLGFMYVRTSRSYSQGIDRKFRNKDYYDLYDPILDNIGEVAVRKSELYALNTSTESNLNKTEAVFGYQEAWYHLKERSNRFSGYFQPGISGTLDSWHYGDNYSALPQASASWLKETADQVDRTIAVTSEASLSFQWSANVYFEYYVTRTMGKYSIPNTFGF